MNAKLPKDHILTMGFSQDSGQLPKNNMPPSPKAGWLSRTVSTVNNVTRNIVRAAATVLKKLFQYAVRIIKAPYHSIYKLYKLWKSELFSLNYRPTFMQKGPTCKLTALAMVHEYYHQNGKIKFLPLNKKNKPVSDHGDKKQEKQSSSVKYENSFREISKKYGSVQGEITSPAVLEQVADEAELDTQTIRVQDYNTYMEKIVSSIQKGDPVVIFVQVDKKDYGIGVPTDDQWTEHAVVVTGFDLKKQTLEIVSHGRATTHSMKEIWEAAKKVTQTRSQEFFFKTTETKNATLVDTSKNPVKRAPFNKWIELDQIYDKTSYRLEINDTVFGSRKDLDNLPTADYIRKSNQGRSEDDHFHQTLMIFTPKQHTMKTSPEGVAVQNLPLPPTNDSPSADSGVSDGLRSMTTPLNVVGQVSA